MPAASWPPAPQFPTATRRDLSSDGLPYDGWLDDQEGELSGVPGSLVLLEVKSSSEAGTAAFYISHNEWRTGEWG